MTKFGNERAERSLIASYVASRGEDDHGITEDDFLDLKNKAVWRAANVAKSKGSMDVAAIRIELEAVGELEYVGGIGALVSLIDDSASVHADSTGYFAKKVKDERRRFDVAKTVDTLNQCVAEGHVDASSLMSAAEELLMLSSDGSHYDKKEVVKATQEYLAERCGKELFGFSWGPKFGFLDKYTKGIQKGRTYRIGAVSNLGKTQFAYNICVSLMEQGKKVAFFTLENDRPFTVTNVVANAMGVNSHKVEDGSVKADFSILDKGELIIVDDTYELGKVFAKVLEIKPDVVILDYVGLAEVRKCKEDDKYTEYAKSVQSFVKRTRVAWIDLNNLPKSDDEEAIRAFGGFYGSSFLRNNADVGIHMVYYKPFYEFRKTFAQEIAANDELKNVQAITMMISKNRIGTAKVEQVYKLNFNRGGRMEEATEQEKATWF